MKTNVYRLLTIFVLMCAALPLSFSTVLGDRAPEELAQPAALEENADFSLPDTVYTDPQQQAFLLGSTGKLTYLRVHDLGTGYGPNSDFIDGEVVIKLNTEPNKAFGFQLRNDKYLPARQGMLDLLRDAFNYNWTVSVDYSMKQGKQTGIIIRVWLTK